VAWGPVTVVRLYSGWINVQGQQRLEARLFEPKVKASGTAKETDHRKKHRLPPPVFALRLPALFF
jgi:hypothetical protein